jgi:hypothetical protein
LDKTGHPVAPLKDIASDFETKNLETGIRFFPQEAKAIIFDVFETNTMDIFEFALGRKNPETCNIFEVMRGACMAAPVARLGFPPSLLTDRISFANTNIQNCEKNES